MKVAHSVIVTPNKCGLYETTRDLVVGLRELGIDSRMVDPTKATNTLHPKTDNDRGASIADIEWAKGADIIVNHSGLGDVLENVAPVIHMAHGRPRHSFMSEVTGSTPIYSFHYAKNKEPNYRAVVTFWPEHVPYLRVMFPDKPVKYIQSSVDLEYWKPLKSGYTFNGKAGSINVVVSDSWRDDIDPFVPLNALALWAREMKNVKIHLYGKGKITRGWAALVRRIQDDGNMGEIGGWTGNLRDIYNAASFVVTNHHIDVRTVREATACGCPVVKIGADIRNYRQLFAQALDADRREVRQEAEQKFDYRNTAKQFKEVLESI